MSRSLERADEWRNSAVLPGDLVAEVRERKQAQDIGQANLALVSANPQGPAVRLIYERQHVV